MQIILDSILGAGLVLIGSVAVGPSMFFTHCSIFELIAVTPLTFKQTMHVCSQMSWL